MSELRVRIVHREDQAPVVADAWSAAKKKALSEGFAVIYSPTAAGAGQTLVGDTWLPFTDYSFECERGAVDA